MFFLIILIVVALYLFMLCCVTNKPDEWRQDSGRTRTPLPRPFSNQPIGDAAIMPGRSSSFYGTGIIRAARLRFPEEAEPGSIDWDRDCSAPIAARPAGTEADEFRDFYLDALEQCAQAAGEQDLHDRILLLRSISENVFLRLETRPEYLPGFKKYRNIYLPKLINAVIVNARMKAGGASVENTGKARADLCQILNIGLKSTQNFLDGMYEGDLLDVETDLEVIRQMFL